MRLIDADAAIEAVEFGITYAKAIDLETGEVRELFKESNEELTKAVERIRQLPPAELDIWSDGTLHISVSKGQLDKIGRVLIEEDGTIFCKQFYQDAQPERKPGRWIPCPQNVSWLYVYKCSECGGYLQISDVNGKGYKANYCSYCGAKMEGGGKQE